MLYSPEAHEPPAGASRWSTNRIPVSPDRKPRAGASFGKSGGSSADRSRYGT